MKKIVQLLALLLLVACGGDATGPADAGISGSYTLKSVGGAPLPAIVAQDATGRIEITAGSLRLNDDKTFSGSISSRLVTSSSTQTSTDQLAGTYVRNNNAIVFNFNDGTQDTGSLSGRQVTVTSSGFVLLFER